VTNPIGVPPIIVQTSPADGEGGPTMARELRVLAVGFVFVFLGAIVIGVF
jgi:hypothetical protein